MSRLTDVALFARFASGNLLVGHCVLCHVWTVTELALLVLEVGIVRGVRPTSKMIIVSDDIVIGRGGRS